MVTIMDGNRRYTRVQGNMEVTRGHELGVDTLEKVLDWSIDLGIEIVTAYAFSTENTKDYHDRLFNLAIGYDGRLEIVDAVKKIYQKIEAGELSIDDVDEKLINDNLYTEGLADPNLIIRTSGEERLSGFLLWQSSYSELYFCDSLWPELRKIDYLRAIRDYQARDRRFGV